MSNTTQGSDIAQSIANTVLMLTTLLCMIGAGTATTWLVRLLDIIDQPRRGKRKI